MLRARHRGFAALALFARTLALTGALPFMNGQTAGATVARPPQYVMVAFDNCAENPRWRELLDFTSGLKGEGIEARYTFFVSGTGLVLNSKRAVYQGPRHRAGTANIDFSADIPDLLTRVQSINEAHRAGHEIASHAVGHFDGSEWTTEEWTSELTQYMQLFAHIADSNQLPDNLRVKAQIEFAPSSLVGFRAPYLGIGRGAIARGFKSALLAAGMRYDTSEDGSATAWPTRKEGLWNFPLANLVIAGTTRPTLSMDYNFYATQSAAKDDLTHAAQYQEQMHQTYLEYFRTNYRGNRAPIHIGHHFSMFQGGAYDRALKQFVSEVCRLPEVKCVTYRELADFMDTLDETTRAAYQHGDFPKL